MNIAVNKLSKRFGEVVAVNNLDLDFHPGVYGLVGHNGAGKSTFLRLLAGILTKDNGEISIGGKSPLDAESKRKVFLLPDDPFCAGSDTIDSLASFYGDFYPLDKKALEAFLREVNLPRNRAVSTFSKGMKRQAFLAIALAVDCPVLLLDEAFDGVDPMVVEMIKRRLIALADEGRIIILSSHNIASLERLVDTFIILSNGKLSKVGDEETMSYSFAKFQASGPAITSEALKNLGLEVVDFLRVGSVCYFVLTSGEGVEEKIREKLNPLFIEPIALEEREIITLEMRLAKKKEEGRYE